MTLDLDEAPPSPPPTELPMQPREARQALQRKPSS